MEKLKIAAERLFLRSPNINVCFRILLKGSIGIKKFDAALDIVCKRHPLLNSAIKIDNDNNAWFNPNSCRVAVDYYNSEEMWDWEIWYKKADDIPFDLIKGPLVRICLIFGNNQTEIIILGHHIIGDGIGYLNLTKDILLALDGKLESIPQMPTINNEFIKNNKLSLLTKMYARILNRKWRKSRIRFSEDDYCSFFYEYRDKFIPGSYSNSIDENGLKKIIEICKNYKLTVNELITSAFAVVMFSGKELPIGIAVNIRNELTTKPYFCMGNYVTGILAKMRFAPTDDFLSNVLKITKLIRRRLKDLKIRHLAVNFLGQLDSDFIESIMYASYGNYKLPISKKVGALIAEGPDEKGLGISNLGRHELKNYNTFDLMDVQFIPPVFPSTLLVVGIITVNNKFNICLRYNKNELDTEDVIKIYNKAIGLLCNNVGGNGS